ncbi:MAG: NAD(P)-binding protein, partial [Acidimicrobiia bacterium]
MPTEAEPEKPNVVILGGGVGAMTAAFYLSLGKWESRFSSITVYQQGWRLGGKGASGRNLASGERIEEHGLHVWFGFYENAFRTMRLCYGELNRPPGAALATVDHAFQRASTFIVEELRPEGWVEWIAEFPEDDQLPGDLFDPTPLPSPEEYLTRAIALGASYLASAIRDPDEELEIDSEPPPPTPVRPELQLTVGEDTRRDSLRRELRALARALTRNAARSVQLAIANAVDLVESLTPDVLSSEPEQQASVHGFIERAVTLAGRHLRDLAFDSDAGRRAWYLGDMFLAIARGMLRYDVLTSEEGFDVIDDFDFSDWLIMNGADEETARSSLITTVVYDLAFAYQGGDPHKPFFSAAAALRGLFRLFFTYKGAIAWKMKAGMGDVVFAPLYEVLHRRGVKFEFFRRVTGVHPSPEGDRIMSVDIEHQADVRPPLVEYQPLVPATTDNLPCWPSGPLFDQLVDGDQLERDEVNFESFWNQRSTGFTTTLAVENDIVVLGIPVGALPFHCDELIGQKEPWRRMVSELETIYTQSFQLWLSESITDMTGQELAKGATTGGFVEPFDTYADMSHLIEQENVSPQPKAIAYFTNAMPTPTMDPRAIASDPTIPSRFAATARANAIRFLREDVGALWPKAILRYPPDFRWALLIGGPEHVTGVDRFDSQFCRANVDPSDRYVLSLPGTARFRLDPGNSGYQNLFLAGDWTK